jgi:hypothetical protein
LFLIIIIIIIIIIVVVVVVIIIIIMPLDMSPTLREEHRLRAFENRVLRRIYGPNRDEVKGEWRKLHSDELHNLYSSPNSVRQIKSRRMRWAGHTWERRGNCTGFCVLVGKHKGKRPLERSRRR